MTDRAPDSRRRLSAETLPEVPLARTEVPLTLAVDIGDLAPGFALRNERDVEVSLSSLRGSPLVVAFAPAALHGVIAASLARARLDLGRRGAVGLLIVAGDTSTAAWVAEPYGRDVVVLADRDGAAHRAYGVLDETGRPRLAVFLLDRRGEVARVFVRAEPERVVQLALDALELAR